MAPNAPLCPWHTSDNILTPLLPSPSWEAALMFCCPVTAVSAWAILKTGPLNPDLLIFQVFKLWLWISPVFPGGSAPQKVGGPRAYPGLLNVLVIQSCLTLCDPMDHSLPGSPVHGISQARILEQIAIPYAIGSSQPRDQTKTPACRKIPYHLSHQDLAPFTLWLWPWAGFMIPKFFVSPKSLMVEGITAPHCMRGLGLAQPSPASLLGNKMTQARSVL